MLQKFTLLLLLSLMLGGVALLLPGQADPAEALAGTMSITNAYDVHGDCSQVAVEIQIEDRFGNTNDDGLFDYYYALVYDGAGNLHATRKLRAAFGNVADVSGITIDENFFSEPIIRPLRVVLYDVNLAGELELDRIRDFPRIADQFFDPATILPACEARELYTINDERENVLTEAPWQTAAIYCRSDGGFDVYFVQDGVNGVLAVRITPAEINAVGIPTENTLLEASANAQVQVWRLSTGEFQVNASTATDYLGYVFRWDGCIGN